MLSFTNGNAKLGNHIAIFSLPAGYACPGACACLSKVVNGRIQDGPNTEFRCYAASMEVLFKRIHEHRMRNFNALRGKTKLEMAAMLNKALPGHSIIRLHVSGDFFSQDYFDAWLMVAELNPNKIFYAYTKSLHFWATRLNQIPSNFRLVASYGGKFDYLIKELNLVNAQVVFSPEQAQALGLEIDKDDSHAIAANQSFALLLHGTQPANTVAAKAWHKIKKTSGGYSRLTVKFKK
jgi:hypothetical protein